MDLYFVESLSLQNHLSAPWPEMSKGILFCGHAIRAMRPYCRVQAKPNWAKTTRILWSASTTWHCSSKPRGVWRMPSLFTVRLSRRAREPSFKDFNGTLASGSGVIPSYLLLMTGTGAAILLGYLSMFLACFRQKFPKLLSFQSTSWQIP